MSEAKLNIFADLNSLSNQLQRDAAKIEAIFFLQFTRESFLAF